MKGSNYLIVNNQEISIPIATTSENELLNFEFTKECGISLVTGRPGSGKSTIIRLIIAGLLKKKMKNSFEIFLVDTTGYEFSEISNFSSECLKGTLRGIDKKDIEDFIDELYINFIEKVECLSDIQFGEFERNIEFKPVQSIFVFIDDVYMMLNNLTSQEHINKFTTLITHGAKYGFRFVLLCQNYDCAYIKLPVIREMIGQRIQLSPYTIEDVLDFCKDATVAGDIGDDEEHFTVLITKKDGRQIKKGELFYINLEEFQNVIKMI